MPYETDSPLLAHASPLSPQDVSQLLTRGRATEILGFLDRHTDITRAQLEWALDEFNRKVDRTSEQTIDSVDQLVEDPSVRASLRAVINGVRQDKYKRYADGLVAHPLIPKTVHLSLSEAAERHLILEEMRRQPARIVDLTYYAGLAK